MVFRRMVVTLLVLPLSACSSNSSWLAPPKAWPTISSGVAVDKPYQNSARFAKPEYTAKKPQKQTAVEQRDGFDSPLALRAKQLKLEQQSQTQTQTRSVSLPIQVLSSPKRNLAESKVSNFHDLLLQKRKVAEETLVFSNDSYVLGQHNKKRLQQMLKHYDPATDVLSVVGCSTGATKLVNGNAALAIGRANRVKEALLYSGVAHDKILDEGCWSSTSNSTPFPNRGVVIVVKRGG